MKRLFIAADIEGVAGVAGLEHLGPKGVEWASARAWMTAEVSAAARVALESGYDEVIVADGHGNALNVLPDALPARTRLVRAWPRTLLQMEGIDAPGVDACFMLGFHGAASAPSGFLSHTYHGGLFADLRLNDVSASEPYINAALAGELGVPTLLITGDDAACSQLRKAMPAIEQCIVKESCSWSSASSVRPEESAQLIAAAAERALKRPRPDCTLKLRPPFILDMEFKNRVTAGLLGQLPCFETIGAGVARFRAATMRDVMRAISFVVFFPRGEL